jgi:hypothetical protein
MKYEITTSNTARLKRIVGWVKRSETQQIPSNAWVSLPQPNLHQLRFRAYPSSIVTTFPRMSFGRDVA